MSTQITMQVLLAPQLAMSLFIPAHASFAGSANRDEDVESFHSWSASFHGISSVYATYQSCVQFTVKHRFGWYV